MRLHRDRQQRWLAGAGSNAGRGHPSTRLSGLFLHWMQDRARAAGLHSRARATLRVGDPMEPVADSLSGFLFGYYKLFRFGSRVRHNIDRPREEKENGFLDTVNEVLDKSLFRKVMDDETYSIANNLADWAAWLCVLQLRRPALTMDAPRIERFLERGLRAGSRKSSLG